MTNADLTEPEIPETGAVFTFGKSKFAENTPSKFWIRRDRIIALSCGDEHTAVVTDSGRLFTFGTNEYGQLGLGHYDNVLRPSCVKCIKPDRVHAVACGKSHTIIATESGRLFAFGSNTEGQLGIGLKDEDSCEQPLEIIIQQKGNVVDLVNDPIVKLAAGSTHSVALTNSGIVYVWGSNKEGQLGLGDEAEEISYTAEKILFDEGPIKDISCGYYHTAIVTESGDLYTFGEADGGKLGLGDVGNNNQDTVDQPTKVDIPEKVCMVSCGGDHTIVLSEDGNVYAFGQSTNGQLGLGTRTLETFVPLRISLLSEISNNDEETNNRIVHISCGENHTAVVSSSGQLFTFGDGRHGKLCLDTETLSNHYSPVISTRFQGEYRVLSAHCGGCHTMVVAQPIPADKRLDTIAENEDNLENVNDSSSVNNENRHDNAQDTSVSVNGLGSMPIPAIGLHKDINVEARMRHRLANDQKLPPIRGVRFDKNQEDIIDEDQDNEVQTNGTIEHSSDQDDSEEDMTSANADVNHDGDDENDDTTSESDEEVKNEGSNTIDAEETVEKNSETKDGLISGFFRKLSNKKSTDAKVETDANANANEDVVEKETDNEATESESKDTGKDNTVVEGKKRVSFLQKIGFKKKSSETLSSNEDKKDEDESSKTSSKDKDKEEGAKTSDEEEESEEDDSVSERKESIDTKIEVTKVEKHVRILEKENSEVHSPTPSSSSNGKNNKKSDAKKSKFCSLL